jgi:hypothetical protein
MNRKSSSELHTIREKRISLPIDAIKESLNERFI